MIITIIFSTHRTTPLGKWHNQILKITLRNCPQVRPYDTEYQNRDTLKVYFLKKDLLEIYLMRQSL